MKVPKQSICNTIYTDKAVIFNIFNTIIGVGIITLPQNIVFGGFFFFLFSIIIIMLMIFYTSMLLVAASLKEQNILSFSELCRVAHGPFLQLYQALLTFCVMFGVISVYCITLRKQVENVISDISGETFKYGQYALIGILVVAGLLSLPKKIMSLSFISVISTVCVFVMIAISIARAPFYHNHFVAMTPAKMVRNERSLDIDRAFWACDPKVAGALEDWGSLGVANLGYLKDSLNKAGACTLASVSWGRVQAEIGKDGFLPPEIQNPAFTNYTLWADVISYEHARSLYDQFSLNREGAEKRGFVLFSVINTKFFIALGTFASAFFFQQGSIDNFLGMRDKSLQAYTAVKGTAFALVYVCCMAIALSGYFGQEYQVGQFIFTNMKMRYFDPGRLDIATIVARLALIISICLTYPMQLFYGRVNLMVLIIMAINKIKHTDLDTQTPSKTLFLVSTAVMWAASTLIGIFFEKATSLFSFIGALFAGQMIYVKINILPIICWYSLCGGYKATVCDAWRVGNFKKKMVMVIVPHFVLVFGTLCTISSTVVTLLELSGVL